ncbi:MAG: heavy metal-binding domain-containing protein [Bacteroidaceae bacterium]|nr:heavy metal-binding domain-containing protein [Bacteroidaceae bacterium]
MITTTTPSIEGKKVTTYMGIVTGETIIGANFIKDLTASLHDFFGGRSTSYEETLREAKDTALREMEDRALRMGANAILSVDLDYETVGTSGSMLMVTCSGTAVKVEDC